MHLWGAIKHLAPLSTDEDLGIDVLLCGRFGHGRLRLDLRAFYALLGGGIFAFEWGGGGLKTLLSLTSCTLNLGARCGRRRARKLSHPLQIVTGHLNDPHGAICIHNIQHIVDKTRRHWSEADIRKRTPVIHHHVCDV